MSEFLSPKERRDLTGYAWRGKQADWLHAKGLPFKTDGNRLIVLRTHVNQWLAGKKFSGAGGINFGAIR